jgi:hypothetical protein
VKKTVINKQKLFIFISIIFIAFCILFYGVRFIYFYKKFNRKTESGAVIQLLTNVIRENNPIMGETGGLSEDNGEFTFKGTGINNYLEYSGYLFRIIKINSDGSILLITDDVVNEFAYGKKGSNFKTSDVKVWLNDTSFVKTLSKENMIKTRSCLDTVSAITNITCKQLDENDSALLNLSDYLNASYKDQNYLNLDEEYWLGTIASIDEAWLIDSDKISKDAITDFYGIRPTITLATTTPFVSGNGSKETPYKVDNYNDIKLGSYIKLGDDLWIVVENANNKLKLAYEDYILNKTSAFGLTNKFDKNENNSLAFYLNNEFYNSLSYKDLIIQSDYYIGEYDFNANTIFSKKTTVHVGLLNVADLKLNLDLANFYTSTTTNEKIYAFDMSGYLFASNLSNLRKIKPVITINKTEPKSGEGTKLNPYIWEDTND